MTNDSAWILTYTGRQFWPLAPRAEDICIEDIAHALSCLCRFTGHCRKFYCVAQHSVLASLLVSDRHKLAALLHDASEAYLCDVPRPLKMHWDMNFYRDAERRLEGLIGEHFNVDIYVPEVRAIDERLLLTERRDLLPPGHWIVDESLCLEDHILPCGPDQAEWMFLQRFKDLS